MTIILPFRRVESLENNPDSCIVHSMNERLEEWRIITDFPNYSVSNFGRVRRELTSGWAKAGKLLVPRPDKEGYLRVDLSKNCDGVYSTLRISRLVAQHFLPPPKPEQVEVAHNDGVSGNNYVTNLRWATRLENEADKRIHGTVNCGARNGGARLSESDVIKLLSLRQRGALLTELAQQFGISKQHVSRISRGEKWKHVA